MSDRGAYVLSAAVLIAAVMLTFVPRRETATPSASPATILPGSPVVQVVEFKDGQRSVVAVLPDGRYAVWDQFGTGKLTSNPERGMVGTK
jgi:hypothetical protein